MTNRLGGPNVQYESNSGVPLAGGKMYFYATGTSSPQNTYSDQALTQANTNPVILDSYGYANNVFLQNLAYKVVLTDANDQQQWTMDPVYTSDYSTYAAFQPWLGNPNGQVAGTAGTQGALPPTSVIWDYQNNILYVCTTTGTSSTAVWTAVNSAASTTTSTPPQGYLTISNDFSNPISTSDVTSSTVHYTPYVGNAIPVYNGASFVTFNQSSDIVLSLVASHAASTIYDVFIFNNSGVLTLVSGPAWASSTAGAGSRGTGGGTTQLQRLNGLWVNAVQITGRNGATTYTIAANTATYVGSIFIDTTPGQVSCFRTYGQNRKWGVWNAYNRVPIVLQAGDSTASWTYNSVTVRASNNNIANSITTFCGLPEEQITVDFMQQVSGGAISPVTQVISQWNAGIGWNSTSAFSTSAVRGSPGFRIDSGSVDFLMYAEATARYVNAPGIGINTATCLEGIIQANGTPTFTWFGTAQNMLMTAVYRG